MKNVHNEHRLDLDAKELINNASDSILVCENTNKNNYEPNFNTRVVLKHVGLASTTSGEDRKSLISNEDSHGSNNNYVSNLLEQNSTVKIRTHRD